MDKPQKIRIAIMASGNGTNAQNLIQYFKNHKSIHVVLVISNRSDAYVLQRAKGEQVPSMVIQKQDWQDKEKVLSIFKSRDIEFVVLAGYLLLLPSWLVKRYQGRIINIHPSLLPRYGGKGMYGDKIHKAVIEAGDKLSGITIHYVNEEYDKGDIIFQTECSVDPNDTPDTLAAKIHKLEYEHFPRVAEKIIREKNKA